MKFNFITKEVSNINVLVYYRDDKNGKVGRRLINKYSKMSNYFVTAAMGEANARVILEILTNDKLRKI